MSTNGVFTGKSIHSGGSELRTESTGLGVAIHINEWAKHKNIDLKAARGTHPGADNIFHELSAPDDQKILHKSTVNPL